MFAFRRTTPTGGWFFFALLVGLSATFAGCSTTDTALDTGNDAAGDFSDGVRGDSTDGGATPTGPQTGVDTEGDDEAESPVVDDPATPAAEPLSPPADSGSEEPVDLAREIEEADIVKEVDDLFFIVNAYKGLKIIDGSDMAAPRLLGSAALGGRGVEMIVRDGNAFILTSADFVGCVSPAVERATADIATVFSPEFLGSRLWVVDVSVPSDPQIRDDLDLDGHAITARRVDDVLYIAGNQVPFFIGPVGEVVDSPPVVEEPSTGAADDVVSSDAASFTEVVPGVFVTSVNIADPDAVALVKTETFDGNSLDLHVSPSSIYVVGSDPLLFNTSLIQIVDIRDPGGNFTFRSQLRVPGFVQNRFFLDEFESVLRVVTERFDEITFESIVSLFTYDVSDPDSVTRLAELPIIRGESLRAVRFDAERGYAVTFLQVDPLFVLDLRDPAAPTLQGELEVPGFSTFLFPLGERLVGVGFDDTDGFRPAVSLYDVADPANPRALTRVIVGAPGSFVSSEATVDEKALKILPDAGLILMPFSGYEPIEVEATEPFFVDPSGAALSFAPYPTLGFDALQIISMTNDQLAARGVVRHPGLVRRAGLRDGAVWVLSDLAFQTVDAGDLDAPTALATLPFVDEQELTDAGLDSCILTARGTGDRVGELDDGAPVDDVFAPANLLSAFCPVVGFGTLALSLAGLTRRRRRQRR